jgi:Flp pilus assembly protein CpaB
VKRQTLVLVVIGVVLFVAGGAIAFVSVIHGTKNAPGAAAPVNTAVVVATSNLPAGTTGQDMVSKGQVSIQLIPQKQYLPTDLPNLQGLSGVVLSSPVKKGEAIQTTQLTASTSSISVPTGLDGITVTASSAAGLAGYLQPGSSVDIYANITKMSIAAGASVPTPNIPVPCTELAMADVEVLDVSSVAPALIPHLSTTTRTVPASLTLLLAVTPQQAQQLTFLSQNETLAVTQTQKGAGSVPFGACIGTGQTTTAP